MLRILTPWDSQPQEATGVDRGNPLGAKLRYASTLGPNVLDVTSGRLATINNAPLTQVGPKGLFRDFVPASSQFLTLPTSNIVSGYPLTVSAWIRFDNLSTTGFIAYSLIGSTYGAIFGQSATAANTLQFNTGSAPGFDGFSAVTAGIVVGEWNHYVLVHRSGSAAAFLNGKPVTITNVGANYGEPAAGNQAIGQRLNGASPRYFDGGIRDFYVFEGELTAAEALSLYQDHYQVFAPRSIWVPVSVGGGGASTITAAAGVATASALAASSTAASTPTAAAGTGTASTVAASSTAASAITSATGTASASTLTGSAVVAGAITAAAGVGAGGTLVGDTLAAGSAAIVAAGGVATTATLGGSSVAAAAIGVAGGVATTSVMGGPGAEPVSRLFAGGFPRREQFRKGYIIKGVRYWLTEEELAVMVAQMLAEISRGDIKQVTAGKPKTISKKTWDAIQVEARIEAVAKQFDDTDEDEDESILMML